MLAVACVLVVERRGDKGEFESHQAKLFSFLGPSDLALTRFSFPSPFSPLSASSIQLSLTPSSSLLFVRMLSSPARGRKFQNVRGYVVGQQIGGGGFSK